MSHESDAGYLRNCLLDYVNRKYGPGYGLTALELERRALDAGNGPEEAFHRRDNISNQIHPSARSLWMI